MDKRWDLYKEDTYGIRTFNIRSERELRRGPRLAWRKVNPQGSPRKVPCPKYKRTRCLLMIRCPQHSTTFRHCGSPQETRSHLILTSTQLNLQMGKLGLRNTFNNLLATSWPEAGLECEPKSIPLSSPSSQLTLPLLCPHSTQMSMSLF